MKSFGNSGDPTSPTDTAGRSDANSDTCVQRTEVVADRSDNKVKATAYDKAGNPSAYAERTGRKLHDEMNIVFTFDANGNLTKKEQTFIYDAGGGGGTQTAGYFYTPANMLEYIDLPGSGSDRRYIYNGLGHRIIVETGEVTVDGQGNFFSFTPTPSLTRKYVYLGGSVIRELDNSDNVVKEYLRGLSLGGGIGGILSCKQGSNFYYYHYDGSGNVSSITDANKKEVAVYEYDSFPGRSALREAEPSSTGGREHPDPASGGALWQMSSNSPRSRRINPGHGWCLSCLAVSGTALCESADAAQRAAAGN